MWLTNCLIWYYVIVVKEDKGNIELNKVISGSMGSFGLECLSS